MHAMKRRGKMVVKCEDDELEPVGHFQFVQY